MSNTDLKFGAWLNAECDKLGWSHSELARRANVSEARVNQVCRGQRAGVNFLSAIAGPLGVSQYDLWRAAGLTPPVKLDDPAKQELLEVFSRLAAPQKRLAIRLMRALLDGE